ncbi:MAG: membrane dipeptidase [Gemmatimonadetes bacterium]|nr:membrane dipeptidase [Gemmatimonadota bacterium]
MDRRFFLKQATASAAAVQFVPRQAMGKEPSSNPRALIMDAMGELRPIYEPPLVRQMLASGIDSITVTLCDPKAVGAEALELAVDGLMEYDRYLAAHPDLFIKATSVADVDAARRAGKMAVFYLYQNATQFDDDLDRVEMFYRLGLVSCQVTYNDRNLAGVGCRAEGDDGGLTDFGRDLVDRMNAVGMLVDLSHANMRTMADTIEHSRMPAIISHTGCNAVHEHVRNTTDANLRRLADHGGVVGGPQPRRRAVRNLLADDVRLLLLDLRLHHHVVDRVVEAARARGHQVGDAAAVPGSEVLQPEAGERLVGGLVIAEHLVLRAAGVDVADEDHLLLGLQRAALGDHLLRLREAERRVEGLEVGVDEAELVLCPLALDRCLDRDPTTLDGEREEARDLRREEVGVGEVGRLDLAQLHLAPLLGEDHVAHLQARVQVGAMGRPFLVVITPDGLFDFVDRRHRFPVSL